MKRLSLALIVLTLGMLFVSSCNEPSPIGAELIESDQPNIVFNDTMTIKTMSVAEDSTLVFDPNPSIEYNNFFIGDYNDPIFGNTKANLTAQLWPSANAPSYSGAILDSVVLILRYDSTNTYGDLGTDPYRLGVYRLTENINIEESYYSDKMFSFDELTPLGETTDFFPQYSSADSVEVFDYTFDKVDTIKLPPHLRINLTEDFGNELLGIDSLTHTSNADFLELFHGIVVKALNPTKGMLSFNLISSVSNLTLYYHTEDAQDTVYSQYKYVLPAGAGEVGVKFSNFEHDHSTSDVDLDEFLNDEIKGDSLLFVQAMSGPNIKIEFPNADQLGDIIVNKAELEFTFAELPEDDIAVYPPLSRSVVVIDDEESNGFAFINDVIAGGTWFGGIVDDKLGDNGETINVYNFNISAHFQQIVDGTVDNTVFIRAFPKQERAARGVLYGAGHSKYPVKLKLTYTELNP